MVALSKYSGLPKVCYSLLAEQLKGYRLDGTVDRYHAVTGSIYLFDTVYSIASFSMMPPSFQRIERFVFLPALASRERAAHTATASVASQSLSD